ncbi:MAG: DNA polymerase I [Candidatus Binataceae bacterium]
MAQAHKESGDRKELILVDGSGYVFRAFFALPQMNNSRGMPTNAVFGFIRMLLKLLKEVRPTHIAVVFDSPGKTFRDDLSPDYKQNRAESPGDLIAQIPYIHRAVEAFRIKRVMSGGVEADDAIGTIARRAAREHFAVTIVTADKDFMQVVEPHVTLWDTMRDRKIGVREIRERFGVEPPALVDIQALTGDQIDNVKGVPGVGEKTASALVKKFGGIDEIYAHLDRIEESGIRGAKRIAELLREHRGAVDLARKLVRIDTEVPVGIAPEDCAWGGIDERAAAELLRELEFNSILREIAPSQAELPGIAPAEAAATGADLDAALDKIRRAPRIGIDIEAAADGSDRMQLYGGGESVTIAQGDFAKTARLLGDANQPKSCHDLKRHIRALGRHRIALNRADFDPMLAGFLIDPNRAEPSLTDLYRAHLARPGGPDWNGTNAELAERLREAMASRLEADGLMRLLCDLEIPAAAILAEMEATGIGVDREALREISKEFAARMERLERESHELAGHPFNLNSPAQLSEILFEKLKLPVKGIKKTKSGYSTDAGTLEKLAGAHPITAKLLEFRAIAKLKSTYADALAGLISPETGRIHTTFHQALTATGRLSSSNPNLQNIPARTEDGRRIRRAFVPRPGEVFVSADYSQIDLRVLAHLSGDATLIEAFQRGEDIHVRTATELLGVAPDHVDSQARRLAKTINFGIIYGMGPHRLAAQLGIALNEAADYIKRYFERLPGVRDYMDETVRKARESGYVTTMYGRRRYLPELNAAPGMERAQAERIAINTPIQGSAADLIKLAMIRLHAAIKQGGLEAEIVMQVHDELLLEAGNAVRRAAGELARREMEGVAELKVPLRVELKSGPNWAEMDGQD